jgi:hypothetical protein
MKHLLVLALISLAPYMAHAIAADSFECRSWITDETTGDRREENYTFQTARLPLSRSPSPDVRITTGHMQGRGELDTKNNYIFSHLNFSYSHAVKLNSAGLVAEARQRTCVTFSVSACSKGTGNNLKICSMGAVSCLQGADPFDPANGWSVVTTIDEHPMFQERDLVPASYPIKDENGKIVGQAYLDCKFKGTYL